MPNMLQTLRTLPSTRSMIELAVQIRGRLQGIDPGAATVKLVTAGLALGIALAVLTDPTSTRNTDTIAEVAARIAPVGSVSVAQASGETTTTKSTAATVSRDS
jgi:hypothetical protein